VLLAVRFIVMALGARSGRPTTTFVGILMLLALSMFAVAVPNAAARQKKTWVAIYPRIDQPGVDAHYYRRPHRFHLTSADSGITFSSFHWRHWGGPTATATGRARGCGEGGPEGFHCDSGRVRLIADHLGTCSITGYGFYQRLVAIRAPFYSGRLEIPVAPESSSCGPP
jgi:hypothetical protein